MLVEFIIPTYDRPKPLASMLASLVAQTDVDWGAIVIIDREDAHPATENVIKMFDDARIKHFYTDKRYNDWGHTPRQMGKQMSHAEYIIMTGDDNYYTPNFVEELKKVASEFNRPGLIYWDMVHSHYKYSFFECKLGTGQIDMGAFATRRDIAHAIPLGLRYDADGVFIEEYKAKHGGERSIKINKVLFVHN